MRSSLKESFMYMGQSRFAHIYLIYADAFLPNIFSNNNLIIISSSCKSNLKIKLYDFRSWDTCVSFLASSFHAFKNNKA
jgi:hypothetical protein